MSSPKKPRPRTERRVREREARDLVHAKQKLAAMQPGGAPERPIEVVSSSVIEIRAASTPCPLCGGSLRVEDHQARLVDGKSLRELTMSCALCGVRRALWFRIKLPN